MIAKIPEEKELDELLENRILHELLMMDHTLCLPLKIQPDREKSRNEIYTPGWVIKDMLDFIKKEFQDKDLLEILDFTVLEICCGHAPFLTSRYDVVTFEPIAFDDRFGVIDQKIKILFEKGKEMDDEFWLACLNRIFRSVYAYDLHADSVFRARCNLFKTFAEAYRKKFNQLPDDETQRYFAYTITQNVFQMDGLTLKHPETGDDVKIVDWKAGNIVRFKDLFDKESQ